MTAFKYSDEGTQKVALVLRKHGIIHEFTTTQATSFTQKMPRTSAHSSSTRLPDSDGNCQWADDGPLAKTFLHSAARDPELLQPPVTPDDDSKAAL